MIAPAATYLEVARGIPCSLVVRDIYSLGCRFFLHFCKIVSKRNNNLLITIDINFWHVFCFLNIDGSHPAEPLTAEGVQMKTNFINRLVPIAVASVALLTMTQAPANAAILTNGNFETGTLSGWVVTNQNTGNWFADAPGTTTPNSGLSTSSAGGSAHGTAYAVSDQGGPGAHALTQSFTLGAASNVVLTWDMFINNYATVNTGTGLDSNVFPTQVGRVDILTAAAGAFDVGSGVLQTCFLGGAPGGTPHAFSTMNCDITGSVGSGGTYQLRFAEADNQSNFNMGIDNIAINVSSVPEPGSLALMGLAFAGLGMSRRNSKK